MNIRKSLTIFAAGLLISAPAFAMEQPNEQEELDRALALSLAEQAQPAPQADDELERALALSLEQQPVGHADLEKTLIESERDQKNKALYENIKKLTVPELHYTISHEILNNHPVIDFIIKKHAMYLKTEWLQATFEEELKKHEKLPSPKELFNSDKDTMRRIIQERMISGNNHNAISKILNFFAQTSEKMPSDIYGSIGVILQKLGEILCKLEPQLIELRKNLTNKLTIEQATLLDAIWKSKEQGKKFALTKELALVYISLPTEVKKALKSDVIKPSLGENR